MSLSVRNSGPNGVDIVNHYRVANSHWDHNCDSDLQQQQQHDSNSILGRAREEARENLIAKIARALLPPPTEIFLSYGALRAADILSPN